MANVTVLGAGGATVTISLSSADNAAAAQTAANVVNKLTLSGIVDQQTWSGSGTLPAPGNVLGGAIVSTAGNVGALSAQYISLAVNAPGNSTVIGSSNFLSTVISGDSSNLTYGNLAPNGEIYLGNGKNVMLNFQGNAKVAMTDGTLIAETDSDASTTLNLAGAITVLTSDLVGQSGKNTINLAAGSKATVLVAGASTIPATVNAASGSLFVVSYDKGSAVINPGAANVTVVGALSTGSTVTGADYGGRVTLFGGTGSVVVANGQGEFTGGSAGKNVMFTSTVAGSATLIGGGGGDQLFALGSGQLIIAGAGKSTLSGLIASGPNSFVVGNGFTTVFGGGGGGNNFIFSGLGSAEVDGRTFALPGKEVQNSYFNSDTDGNDKTGGTFFISDFVTGVDKLLIAKADTATVTYFAPGAVGSPLLSIGGTQVVVSSGTTYNFFESGALGQDIFATDIQKI